MDADVRISHEGGASGGAARAERCDCPIPESLVNLEGRARVVVTNHTSGSGPRLRELSAES